MNLIVTQESPQTPDATALLKESHLLLESLYSADENHFLSVEALAQSDVRFFVARDAQNVALGCGALAIRTGYGEVKSMFVSAEARGRGVAATLLERLENEARSLGLPLLRLETGDVLDAAHRLYGRHGFDLRGPFGEYPDTSASLFMEKQLA